MINGSIKILLVDDEPDALDLMGSLLENMERVTIVGKANSKSSALEAMIKQKPDVIFQDIRMHEADGLEMTDAYRLHHYTGHIVFVTAHSEYAIEAIKKAAYDYLLKPVGIDDLNELVLRLLTDRMKITETEKQKLNKLKIPTRTGFTLLNTEEIVYCQADGNYTNVLSVGENRHTTSVNLGRLESALSEDVFFRLNRSVIINLDYLSVVNKGGKTCLLRDKDKIYSFRVSSKTIKILEKML